MPYIKNRYKRNTNQFKNNQPSHLEKTIHITLHLHQDKAGQLVSTYHTLSEKDSSTTKTTKHLGLQPLPPIKNALPHSGPTRTSTRLISKPEISTKNISSKQETIPLKKTIPFPKEPPNHYPKLEDVPRWLTLKIGKESNTKTTQNKTSASLLSSPVNTLPSTHSVSTINKDNLLQRFQNWFQSLNQSVQETSFQEKKPRSREKRNLFLGSRNFTKRG
jgi:hypothetical protein